MYERVRISDGVFVVLAGGVGSTNYVLDITAVLMTVDLATLSSLASASRVTEGTDLPTFTATRSTMG